MANIIVSLDPHIGRPDSFTLGERLFQVRVIIDRWFGADYAYVKVVADDGNLYILRHDLLTDGWEMVLMDSVPDENPAPA
jgi:hypothetical protein